MTPPPKKKILVEQFFQMFMLTVNTFFNKKNSRVEPANYRPVSILSIISKIFERVLCEQLTDYLTCNNYLY